MDIFVAHKFNKNVCRTLGESSWSNSVVKFLYESLKEMGKISTQITAVWLPWQTYCFC
jgi:hypothetical protein